MVAVADAPRLSAPFEAQFDKARAQDYAIQRLIRQIHTADLVKVLAVYPTEGTTGFVDVQPMVLEATTTGVLLEQSPIYKVPYLRLQGGLSAVVLDPVVGDIGVAIFAERDISTVISTREPAGAPTARAYSSADGLYLGGFLNADPTQYVRFDPEGGIEIVSTGDLTLSAPGDASLTVGGKLTMQVTGTVTISAQSTSWAGPVSFSNPVTMPQATIGGVPFTTHKHFVSGTGTNSGTPVS